MARVRKKAEREGRTIVWVDESGFYLLPAVVRTYAPCGKTPILRHKLGREHLSVIGGVTREGKLCLSVQERAYCSEDVVRFLRHLLRHLPGKRLVIWDGAPIHRGRAVRDFLSTEEGKRIYLGLPGYAPELNPSEGIWGYLKRVELKNLCCNHLKELKVELRRAKERLRHRREVLLGCIRQTGYVFS